MYFFMKNSSTRILAVVIILFSLGCNKPDDGSFTAPITTYEQIAGEWSLMNLTMVDEYAKANDIEPYEENISTLFDFEDFRLVLNINEDMRPTSYEVIGDVPPLFQLEGFWELNYDFQPTGSKPFIIYLYSDQEKTNLVGELQITSVPRSNDQMEIQLLRTAGDVPFVSYNFKLIEE